ncbi:AraC family transcriptional regulator [Pedobacter sp. KBW06]|uniref:helix-turn-helix domain-containing protein n=1 Tax=Pedobacter sp. KBW06 TaxID=2153359 RepID=UPI000F5AAEA7|nr:AraC family transcriptional regulator [Pedobacter sp. KBW06]RQO65910.1 AraC family transcriptional regulator [Pedobacter sp. KBW06]
MYVVAGLFNIILTQFEQLEIDVQKIFAEFKTELKVLENATCKINAGICGRYLEQVVLKTKDPRIGLKTGFLIPFTLTDAVFNTLHKTEKLAEIFDRTGEAGYIATDITSYTTRVAGDSFHYELKIHPEFSARYPQAARVWAEMQYGTAIHYAHGFTGRFLHPVLVHSPYPQEGVADQLGEYLNCPAKYNQDCVALVFPKSILELPVVPVQKKLLPLFEELEREIREKQYNRHFSYALERHLLHSISNPGLGLKSAALRFNMSERNMQRRLKTEGSSYQLILNKLRMELSQKYLKEDVSLNEIAFLLGFDSQSAFNKFFQKQFRTTPGKFTGMNANQLK